MTDKKKETAGQQPQNSGDRTVAINSQQPTKAQAPAAKPPAGSKTK